jgi:hypothetical protein
MIPLSLGHLIISSIVESDFTISISGGMSISSESSSSVHEEPFKEPSPILRTQSLKSLIVTPTFYENKILCK